jgi:serine/threonine protein kinase
MFIQGKLKLIDFGISAQVSDSTEITSILREQPVGTISFMAPESLKRDQQSGRMKPG